MKLVVAAIGTGCRRGAAGSKNMPADAARRAGRVDGDQPEARGAGRATGPVEAEEALLAVFPETASGGLDERGTMLATRNARARALASEPRVRGPASAARRLADGVKRAPTSAGRSRQSRCPTASSVLARGTLMGGSILHNHPYHRE